MNYEYRDRARHNRSRYKTREDAPQSDAVTSALTAQVIICILLIICMMLAKSFDRPRYDSVKEQYGAMLSDGGQTDKAIEWVRGSHGYFGAIYNAAREYISGFFPAKPDAVGPESEPEDEPEDTAADMRKTPAFAEYDYLGKGVVTYLSAVPVNDGTLLLKEQTAGGILPALAAFWPGSFADKIMPPITGVITSGFSYRHHPVTDEGDYHTGIDIAAEEGREITAALDGEVAEVGESEIYGNYIILRHPEDLKTSYSHCSEIFAEEGDAVKQGELIALVGQTGIVTGPHLHFSAFVNDKLTDPARLLKKYIETIDVVN